MNKEQYIDWMQNKCTIEFINRIKESRFNLQQEIATGFFVGFDLDRAIGRCLGLQDAVVIVLEDMKKDSTTESVQDAFDD